MSRDCCVALSRGAMGYVCLRFVIVVFPDHTNILFSEFAFWDFKER